MANKLTSITTQYRTFKVDQVLTHSQLNESIAFFEDQDRLTRVFLNGVGLVCGFKVELSGSPARIRITQGVGVTTDGDLLKLLQDIENNNGKTADIPYQEFAHFRVFEDDKGRYTSHFEKAEEQTIELWELVPLSRKQDTDRSLEELPDLDQKVALLYLETYAKEADLCAGMDCDNQGVEQVARIRVLLTTNAGADHLISKDVIYRETHTHRVFEKLQKVNLKRVHLKPSKDEGYTALENSFLSVIFQKEVQDKLYTGLSTLFYFLKVNKFELDLKPYLDQVFDKKKLSGFFQYDYDWLKDIVDTYHEILDLFFQLDTLCLPDIKAFPKHLMLGLVKDNSVFPKYRHGFYASPVTGDKRLREKLFHLVGRLLIMAKSYGVQPKDIRITPSRLYGNLGDKAIPFYYKPSPTLIDQWDYETWRRRQQMDIYRYFGEVSPNSEKSKNPLEFDLEGVDFFRIEGHQGLHFERAMVALKDMVFDHRLDFDVKAIGVDEDDIEIKLEDYACHFEDLLVLMEAWNDEMTCAAGKIAAFFSEIDIKKLMGAKPAEEESNWVKPESTKKVTDYSRYKEVDFDKVAAMIRSGEITLAEAQKLYPHLFESTKTYSTKDRDKIQQKISESILMEEGMLGTVFYSTIKSETPTYLSYANIKVEAEKEATHYIKDLELSEPIKEAFVHQPIDIIATAYDISYYIPEQLMELDSNYIGKYEESIEDLCQKLKDFSKQLEKLDISDRIKSHYQSQALYFTSICCAANKLKILQAEIENRKKNILKELKFPKFLERHPGLEHKAGVSRGGTFVLVYINKSKTIKKSNIKWPDKTVVADFMLPYRCCSDCTPINFVVPRPVVFLSLERDTYCLGLDEAPITFEVFPQGGTVSSSEEVKGLIIGAQSIRIDPELFTEDMLGKPISFMVNGETTEATLTVHQAPVFELILPEMPIITNKVELSATSIDEPATYTWDFGDGTSVSSDQPSQSKTYDWPVNGQNRVTVSLTITPENGACPKTVSGEIIYSDSVIDEEVSLDLERKEICRDNHPDPIAFEVSPEDGQVQGEGVRLMDGKYYFDPNNVSEIKLGKSLGFTVNGKETDLVVRVYKKPTLDFSYSVTQEDGGKLQLHLEVITPFPEGTEFIWIVDGQERDDTFEGRFTLDFSTDQVETEVSVSTHLKNVCEVAKSATKTIPLNRTEPEPTTCIDEGIQFIHSVYKRYSELIKSDEFSKVDEWGQGIIHEAVAELEQIAKSPQEYLEGKNNDQLPELFKRQLAALSEYLMQMNSEEATIGFTTMSDLYALYIQLFYILIKCQNKELLDKHREQFESILQQITNSMAQLLENRVIWDPNRAMLRFFESIKEAFKEVGYVLKSIDDQSSIINQQ